MSINVFIILFIESAYNSLVFDEMLFQYVVHINRERNPVFPDNLHDTLDALVKLRMYISGIGASYWLFPHAHETLQIFLFLPRTRLLFRPIMDWLSVRMVSESSARFLNVLVLSHDFLFLIVLQ